MRRKQPIGRDISGLLWLLASSGITVACGWTLQVLAIHRLDDSEYATFIFGLGLGSIAAVLGTAIQPVVAAARMRGEGRLAFASPGTQLTVLGLGSLAGVLITGSSLGYGVASALAAQVPMSLAVGVVSGELQAERSYRALGVGAVLWTTGRLGFAAIGDVLGYPAAGFLLCLPLALGVQLAWLVFANNRSEEPSRPERPTPTASVPWKLIFTWGLLAWIVYGDAVMARVSLSAAEAAEYGIALTLGRQVIYLAAPVATVILPAALLSDPRGRRTLFLLMAATTAAVLLMAAPALALLPQLTVRLLLLHPAAGSVAALRLYSLIGTASFSILLSASFLTGVGRPMNLVALVSIVASSLIAIVLSAQSAAGLATIQCCSSAAAAAVLLRGCVMHLRETPTVSSSPAVLVARPL